MPLTSIKFYFTPPPYSRSQESSTEMAVLHRRKRGLLGAGVAYKWVGMVAWLTVLVMIMQGPYHFPTFNVTQNTVVLPLHPLPSLVEKEFEHLEKRAYTVLLEGLASNSTDSGFPFDNILVSLPLHADLFHSSTTGSEGDKFFVAPLTLQQQRQECVVYAAGLADSVGFENYMASSVGCRVHGFDCTVLGAKPHWNFTFHDTCIGQPLDFESHSHSLIKRQADISLSFKRLDTIKAELGHSHVDILKMDIEGFEWDILTALLDLSDADLPWQLLLELHAEGANPAFVPASLVKGKTRQEVAKLFLRLHDQGYRVVYKEINVGDPYCADFTLLMSQQRLPHPRS